MAAQMQETMYVCLRGQSTYKRLHVRSEQDAAAQGQPRRCSPAGTRAPPTQVRGTQLTELACTDKPTF